MSLFERLQKASSEEDVKAEYIKALRLKQVQRNLIDIQTREVWFEAKFGSKKSLYEMFTQLLFYIHRALKDGEHIPPFLWSLTNDLKESSPFHTGNDPR